MDAALITFAACLLMSFCGRAHLTIGMMAISLGRSAGLLLVAVAASLFATAVVVLAGQQVAVNFNGEVLQWIIVVALIGGAAELVFPFDRPRADEPTRSLGAIGIVLFLRQIFDAPRLCLFASAAALPSADHAVIGGGGAAARASFLAWFFADCQIGERFRYVVRLSLAVIVLLLALLIGSITK